MPVIAAVVCPHPPLLIPEVAAGAAGELDDLRLACDTAVGAALGSGADTVVMVGSGEHTGWVTAGAYASFVAFGVSIEFPAGIGGPPPGLAGPSSGVSVPPDGPARLPLSLSVGAWLLANHASRTAAEDPTAETAGKTATGGLAAQTATAEATGEAMPGESAGKTATGGLAAQTTTAEATGEAMPGEPAGKTATEETTAEVIGKTAVAVEAVEVAVDAAPEHCANLAARLRDRADRVALLVLGDGSARRGERSPGHDDADARSYDDRVARALARADTAALRGLDPVLSTELSVAGRAPWQVLAGAAGDGWRGHLTYYAAPYGVAYFVAHWSRP